MIKRMLFSIITVTYNNLEGLKRTQESLRAQNNQDFDWIVIDGDSNDGTVSCLKDTGAWFISEPDQGIYDAMNKGIEHAKGDYLLFLNAGDELAAPEILSNIEALTKGQTPDFIYGDALEERAEGPPACKPARAHTKIAWGLFTHHQAMIYHRETIKRLRYDLKYKIAADYKFTAQFLKNCSHVVYYPHPICLFESGGLSQRQAREGRTEQSEIRRAEKLTGRLMDFIIVSLQKLVWAGKMFCPQFYWFIRKGRGRPAKHPS